MQQIAISQSQRFDPVNLGKGLRILYVYEQNFQMILHSWKGTHLLTGMWEPQHYSTPHLGQTERRLMWLETIVCCIIPRKQGKTVVVELLIQNLGRQGNNTLCFYKMVNSKLCIVKQNEIY